MSQPAGGRARPLRHVLAAASLLLLAACGGAHDDVVRQAADDWARAVGSQDWEAACTLLAPRTLSELEKAAKAPCHRALPAEATDPPDRVAELHVYGKAAQVTWGEETLYLADFSGRWLVWAASCTRTGADRPYDCAIAGG